MNKQKGATLVVALSLLTIITLVAVYTMENSSIQSRMLVNSVVSYSAFQDTNNELMGQVRYFDTPDGLAELLGYEATPPTAPLSNRSTPVHTTIATDLIYTDRKYPCSSDEVGVDSPVECPIFEVTSIGEQRSSISNQSVGVYARKLAVTGTVSITQSN